MSDPRGDRPRLASDDRAAVDAFAAFMLEKLRQKSHKAHWSTVSTGWLLARLLGEVAELADAIESRGPREICDECRDVANLAMMISDNLSGR